MIYIVTHGDYSDYTIKGVFSTEEDAEAFRNYYNYDYVEDHGLDQKLPDIEPMDLWQYTYEIKNAYGQTGDRLKRVSNDCMEHEWKELSWGDYIGALCVFWAKDESHAEEIAAERLNELLKQEAAVTGREVVYIGSMANGMPSNRATHRQETTYKKTIIDGELVEIDKQVITTPLSDSLKNKITAEN